MQYGLFLKGIGLTLEDSLKFWRQEFSKGIGEDKVGDVACVIGFFRVSETFRGWFTLSMSRVIHTCLNIYMSNNSLLVII